MPQRRNSRQAVQQASPLTNESGAAVKASAPAEASGEGFYQGLVGRKTGRPSPRPMGRTETYQEKVGSFVPTNPEAEAKFKPEHRMDYTFKQKKTLNKETRKMEPATRTVTELSSGAPRHEAILAAHGLMDQGAADSRQGQLFAPHELPQAESARALAAKHGVAAPLAASRPGFMPELYEAQGGGTVSTAEAHKRMVAGIKRSAMTKFDLDPTPIETSKATHLVPGAWSENAQAHLDASVGPVGRMMRERQTTRDTLHPGDAPWYASRTPISDADRVNPNQGTFDLGPGSATEMIASAANRQGVNYPTMSRATAQTSPRTRWIGGTPGTDDFSAPNLESAENIIHAVKSARASGEDFDPAVLGASTHGAALGREKAKAAVGFAEGSPSDPVKIKELQSQKVPNFDQSLMLSHPSQAIRRQAALSYTPDTHDTRSTGKHEDFIKTPGGMALTRMTGRRESLRRGELAPMSQSGVWEAQKLKEPEAMGQHSLLETKRGGKIAPRAESNEPYVLPGPSKGKFVETNPEDEAKFAPEHRMSHRFVASNDTGGPSVLSHQMEDRRSPLAKSLDIEF